MFLELWVLLGCVYICILGFWVIFGIQKAFFKQYLIEEEIGMLDFLLQKLQCSYDQKEYLAVEISDRYIFFFYVLLSQLVVKSDSDVIGFIEYGVKQVGGKKLGMCFMWFVSCKCVLVIVGDFLQ